MIFFFKIEDSTIDNQFKNSLGLLSSKFSRDTTIQIVEYMDLQTLVFIKF